MPGSAERQCVVCGRTGIRAKDMCSRCYQRAANHGDPHVVLSRSGEPRHDMTDSPEHVSWWRMIQRCTNPNDPGWEYYGGRGVTVCEEWRGSFLAFYRDMGPRPEGTTLDRIRTDGNYEPGNCRWATRSMQSRNRRKQAGTSSRFIGVSLDKRRGTWSARIRINGRTRWLGSYAKEEEAAEAYKLAAGLVLETLEDPPDLEREAARFGMGEGSPG